MLTNLAQDFVDLNKDEILETVKKYVESGGNPIAVIEEAQKGMEVVGKKFEEGDFYLAEILISAEIFKETVKILDPYMNQGNEEKIGKVVIATPSTDIHDLGKNIVVTMLKVRGFDVIDLGVDVPVETIVDTAINENADFVGLSMLLTTAIPMSKQVNDILVERGVRDKMKFIIGGAVTNETTRTFCNADFQSTDVMKSVSFCLDTIGGR